MNFKTLTLLSFLFLSSGSIMAQSSFQFSSTDLKNSLLEHGDFLYKSGEYAQSLAEFRQFTSLFPEDNLIPIVYYKIALTFLKLNQQDKAREYLQKIQHEFSHLSIAEEAHLREIMIDYEAGDYLSVLQKSAPEKFMPYRIISAYALIRLHWFEEADSVLALCMNDSFPVYAPALQEIRHQLKNFPKISKSKKLIIFTASTILPGSGRFFLRQNTDAGISIAHFILLTLFALDNDFLNGRDRKTAEITISGSIPEEYASNSVSSEYSNSHLIYPDNKKILHSGSLHPMVFVIAYYILNFYSTERAIADYEQNLVNQKIDEIFQRYPINNFIPLYNPFE